MYIKYYVYIYIYGSYPWILSFWNIHPFTFLIKIGRLLLGRPLAKGDKNSSFGRIFPCHCGEEKPKGCPQFFPA